MEAFIPILVEATKFVFEETGKWLDQVRKKDPSSRLESSQADISNNLPSLTQQEFSQLEANPTSLMSAINIQMAKTNVYEMKSLVKQIQIHRQNLVDFETTKAEYGALTPQHIKWGIERETSETIEKSLRLKKMLESIYGKKLENTSNI